MNEEKLSRAFDEITLIRGIFLVFFFFVCFTINDDTYLL